VGIPFYDCKDLDATSDGWLDIERIYCFDWDAFTPEDMDRLRLVFASLPQSKRHDSDDCHWWFADHEDVESGYLTAGIELPGLQVFGTLPAGTWAEWDRVFQQAIDGLPVRAVS
jgi:hypothetical protein